MATITFEDALQDPSLVDGFDPENDVLQFNNANAAEVRVGTGSSETTFTTAAGSLTVPINTATITGGPGGNVRFADNSRIVIGDDDTDTSFDGGGNTLDANNDGINNLLVGLEGGDDLTASSSGDEMYGNQGGDTFVLNEGADTVFGGQDNDTVNGATGVAVGGSGADLVYGNQGADSLDLSRNSGNDSVFGGQGDDVITVGTGDNLVYGNLGDDELTGNSGDDQLWGQAGDDTINTTGGGADTVIAGEGDDSVDATAAGDDSDIYGNQGADTIEISDGAEVDVFGGQDDDVVSFTDDAGSSDDVRVYGNQGDDELASGDGNDSLFGGQGSDTISAGSGSDLVYGGVGADSLNGGNGGHDSLYGGDGDDTIVTGSGTAVVSGGTGDDSIDASSATGTIEVAAGIGADTVEAAGITTADAEYSLGDGDDVILFEGANAENFSGGIAGGAGDDTLRIATSGTVSIASDGDVASIENVVIADNTNADIDLSEVDLALDISVEQGGVAGTHAIVGSSENDTITGGAGDETIDGSAGNDEVNGGIGSDVLAGGAGSDTLTGGGADATADTFSYTSATDAEGLRGLSGEDGDVITDFASGTDALTFNANAIVEATGTGTAAVTDPVEVSVTEDLAANQADGGIFEFTDESLNSTEAQSASDIADALSQATVASGAQNLFLFDDGTDSYLWYFDGDSGGSADSTVDADELDLIGRVDDVTDFAAGDFNLV